MAKNVAREHSGGLSRQALFTQGLPRNITATSNPGVGDDIDSGYNVGSIWVNVSSDAIYFCGDATAGAAVWALTASTAITQITALSKTDGNFIVGNGSAWVAESGATARTSVGVGTGDSPQFTGIELGHATDTTIARSSSGAITVEGTAVLLAGDALTGTTIDATTDFTIGTTVITDDAIAMDAGVITLTPTTSDTVTMTAAANGAFSIVTVDAAAAAANIQITADGTVDIDSAGVLTLDSGAAINIEPASGSAILLDGTISIDGGVVTGATSITSTAFVGDITGDVTGTADTATVATTVTITDNESTSETNAVIFTAGADLDGGNLGLESDGDFTYTPNSGTVAATIFSGALSGNATTATALASGRTIAMTGDVAWTSASFDGSGNVTGAGTIQANAVEGSMLNTNTISGQTEITSGLAAADELLYDDGGVIKKIGLDNFVELSPALATEDAVADGDYFLFLDGGATGNMNKEAVHDLATLFAGTGLTASSSVIGVNASQTQVTAVGTIATGTWEATDVGVAHGGTGASTLLTNAILTGNGTSAIQAETDLLFASNVIYPTATAHDTAGKVLTISAGDTTAGTTNNIAGGALTFQGGQGKGSGAGGAIIFQTANAAGSGSSLNALATRFSIEDGGKATFTAGFDVGSDAAGDTLYHNGTSYIRLAKGSDTEVLTLASGVPVWAAPTIGDITGVTAGDGLTGGGSSGGVSLALDLVSNGGLEIQSAEVSVAQGISQYDVAQFAASVADNDFLRIDGTAVEGLSASEVAAAIESSIDAVGTIATGVWQGTDVGVAYGGTGVSTLLTNAVLTGNGASAIQAESTLLFASNKLIPTASAHDAAGTVLTVSAGATTAGTSNNQAGGALTFQGGQGKGSGAGGNIIFQTANAGGSGSSINSLATAVTISDDLSVTLAGTLELGHASDTTLTRSGSGDVTIEGNAIYRAGGTDVPVADGGTGASTFTANGVLIGNGTSAVSAVDMSTKGGLLAGDGSGNPSILAVGGTGDHVLTVDSSEATGMKWAAVSAGAATSLAATSSSANEPIVSIENTHADATAGYLKFIKNPGSGQGADADILGTITWYGTDASNNAPEELARIDSYVVEADHGSEAGGMRFYVAENDATMTAGLQILGQATADGEIDVTIGAGTASTTTIAGTLTMGSTASMTNAGLVSVANQSNITGLSTITSGVWEGTDVGVAHGGTGVSTLLANAVLTGNGTSAIQAETTLLFSSNKLIPTAAAHDAAGTVLTMSAGATTAGTSNNQAGGALTFQGGQGKGSGAGGAIIFQVANEAGSGSSLNALATALTINDDKTITTAGAIELGHASDTTLVRASSGDVNIEGNRIYRAGGTDVAIADGGTGAGTAAAGFDALSPMSAEGDILYGGASSGNVTKLAKGSDGEFLKLASGVPSWASVSSAAVTALNSATANELVTVGATTTELDAETNLTYASDLLTTASSSADLPRIDITNTHAGATAGKIRFNKDSASGDDNDVMGTIEWYGTDAGEATHERLAYIDSYIIDSAAGSEAAGLRFYVAENDATNTLGLQILGQADDNGEVDVTIGAGAASTTTIAGTLTMGSTAAMTNAGLVSVANQSGITGLGTLSSIDIDGGAIDGAIIGANSAAAGTFAALVSTSFAPTLDISLADDKKIIFGGGSDASIEYDENGTDQLRIAGTGVVIENDVEIADSKFIEFASAAGTPTTDNKVQGIVIEFLAVEAITQFDAVYVSTTTGRVGRALATNAAKMPVIGIAIETQGSAGSSVRVLTHGVYRDDGGFSGNMTVGVPLYAPEALGTLTTTIPADDGDLIQVIGVAIGVRSAFINPSLDVIEHA